MQGPRVFPRLCGKGQQYKTTKIRLFIRRRGCLTSPLVTNGPRTRSSPSCYTSPRAFPNTAQTYLANTSAFLYHYKQCDRPHLVMSRATVNVSFVPGRLPRLAALTSSPSAWTYLAFRISLCFITPHLGAERTGPRGFLGLQLQFPAAAASRPSSEPCRGFWQPGQASLERGEPPPGSQARS